jgi:hypothetical protein
VRLQTFEQNALDLLLNVMIRALKQIVQAEAGTVGM